MASSDHFPAESPGVALVTGGSRGIGRAISERLACIGHPVVINYASDAAAAEDLADSLNAKGFAAHPMRGDVCTPRAVADLYARIDRDLGERPAVVVNNVGEFGLGAIHDTGVDRWNRIIDSNLNSAFYVTREALPDMRRRRHGRIVFIGMAATLRIRGAANVAAYAIAKTGVAVLARTLASEEAGYGITANCVAPGLIDNGYLPPAQATWMVSRVPSGRLGRPEEVADAVAFLLSDQAQYVSGATLSVSGGWDWDNRQADHDTGVERLFTEGASDD
jgi:3-oxoacyl-[acyl-carrier protein] reductase